MNPASKRCCRRCVSNKCMSSPLLPYGKVYSLQDISRLVLDLDVPRPFRIGRDCLAAPRPPWRSADRQRNVAHLIVAVKPDVMQRLAVGTGHAHPQHDRADAVRKGGAGILRRAV